MNDLFLFAAHNTIVGLLLALVVLGLTRVWRNPPVVHVLWLLVLLKLVAPPIVRVDWSVSRLPGSMPVRTHNVSHIATVDRPTDRTTNPASGVNVTDSHPATSMWATWNRGRPVLLSIWLGGAGLFAVVAATRIVRFERLLRDTLPASERVQRLALDVAGRLGVRRVPNIRYADFAEVPLLWWAGRRPTIVLPVRLLGQIDDQEATMIVAHELAHLRRRDHWVRLAELFVSSVYWWNPLVWVIRRQIHQAEDLCCDAWVRWVFPDGRKRYSEVLLKAAESLGAAQAGQRLLPASPFLHSLSLKARIEMILESTFAPRVSTRAMCMIALLALPVVLLFVQATWTEARADSENEAAARPAGKPETRASAEFPYAVEFEQGATRFADGDKITIDEIRGTAATFIPGNIYWIKGTYKLASHERATLAAYTTAMESKDGTGYSFDVQTTVVDRGNGTFTLFLPMSCRGWPHVSFYPADGGEGFGGNYFGTGDSVLKRWWGSQARK